MTTCPDCIKCATRPDNTHGEYSVKVIDTLVHLARNGKPVCQE